MLFGSTHFFSNTKKTKLTKLDKITEKHLELAAQEFLSALEKWDNSEDDFRLYFFCNDKNYFFHNKKEEQSDESLKNEQKSSLINQALNHIQKAELILLNTEGDLSFKPKSMTKAYYLLLKINGLISKKYRLSEFSKKELQFLTEILRYDLLENKEKINSQKPNKIWKNIKNIFNI